MGTFLFLVVTTMLVLIAASIFAMSWEWLRHREALDSQRRKHAAAEASSAGWLARAAPAAAASGVGEAAAAPSAAAPLALAGQPSGHPPGKVTGDVLGGEPGMAFVRRDGRWVETRPMVLGSGSGAADDGDGEKAPVRRELDLSLD